MNERQKQLLEWIRGQIEANGYAPTIREMQAGMKYQSNNSVRWQLHRLEKAGAIQWTRRIARGIRVLPNGKGET